VGEIWLADAFWPSEGSNMNKHETGSSIERLRLPSLNIDMTLYFGNG